MRLAGERKGEGRVDGRGEGREEAWQGVMVVL